MGKPSAAFDFSGRTLRPEDMMRRVTHRTPSKPRSVGASGYLGDRKCIGFNFCAKRSTLAERLLVAGIATQRPFMNSTSKVPFGAAISASNAFDTAARQPRARASSAGSLQIFKPDVLLKGGVSSSNVFDTLSSALGLALFFQSAGIANDVGDSCYSVSFKFYGSGRPASVDVRAGRRPVLILGIRPSRMPALGYERLSRPFAYLHSFHALPNRPDSLGVFFAPVWSVSAALERQRSSTRLEAEALEKALSGLRTTSSIARPSGVLGQLKRCTGTTVADLRPLAARWPRKLPLLSSNAFDNVGRPTGSLALSPYPNAKVFRFEADRKNGLTLLSNAFDEPHAHLTDDAGMPLKSWATAPLASSMKSPASSGSPGRRLCRLSITTAPAHLTLMAIRRGYARPT